MIKKTVRDGINLYMIKDKKFKAFRICVMIHRPLTRREVTKNTLLTAVLRMQSKNYPTPTSISEALESLYGADLIARASKYGESQIIKIGIQSICDSAAGEGNFNAAIKLLYDIVVCAGDGQSFSESITQTEKKNIYDAISAQKNDKRSYSVLRLQEEMCRNEAYGTNPLGYIDELEKINAESLYSHYKKVMAESRIDIIFTGNFDESAAEEETEKFMAELAPRKGAEIVYDNPHTVSEIREVTDKMDVTQGKLCIGFRCPEFTSTKNYHKVIVYNAVYGGTATSKLFNNVREKLSLCYYVGSSIDRLKEIMIVRSGVEFDSFGKAYDEILNQQEKMCSGDFSDEEIVAAKKQLVNAYRSNYDSIIAMEEYYTMQILLGTDTGIDEMTKKIEEVTRDDITEAAKAMVIDTVYKLENEE